MKTPWCVRSSFSGFPAVLLPCYLLVLSCCGPTWGRSIGDYAGTYTNSATTESQTNQAESNARAAPPNTAADPSKTPPPPEVVNRKALEQRAGKSPCKLLLRSTPSAAQVYVDGAFVGESPLLLIVAPGKYQIEMRGRRLEFGERAVDLLPRETREVALSLTSRYPTRVTAH
jgi:PEGA domain